MRRPGPDIPDEDAALMEELARLAADYRRELPERLTALDEAVTAALDPAAGPATLRRAQLLAHNLRGSARSFGLGELGEAAAALDEELARPVDPEDRGRLLACLARLRELAA